MAPELHAPEPLSHLPAQQTDHDKKPKTLKLQLAARQPCSPFSRVLKRTNLQPERKITELPASDS